ncbi:hypothetical protein GCM10025734_17660 [Kitasatospora paranensis]
MDTGTAGQRDTGVQPARRQPQHIQGPQDHLLRGGVRRGPHQPSLGARELDEERAVGIGVFGETLGRVRREIGVGEDPGAQIAGERPGEAACRGWNRWRPWRTRVDPRPTCRAIPSASASCPTVEAVSEPDASV